MNTPRPAVVLLSGGLDSATVLAQARAQGFACHALSLDYGQRHRAELHAARRVAQALGAVRHEVLAMDFSRIARSALTSDDIAVPVDGAALAPAAPGAEPTIPSTYVPARNTIFLSLALGYAETIGARDIFVGANAVDYSGYPDCRPEYIAAFERLANLATKAGVEARSDDERIRIHAPIIALTKSDIVRAGHAMGLDYGLTVSCYQADDEGRACGVCDACRLRRQGFLDAGLADPTRYRPGA